MVTEFLNGEYDLMGGTYYSPEFEEHFAYPNYSCGHNKSLLLARQHDYSIRVKSLDGKTIGVYENAQEGIRRLNEYLLMNAVNCTLKSYTYGQLTHAPLTEYLKRGEVDLVLGALPTIALGSVWSLPLTRSPITLSRLRITRRFWISSILLWKISSIPIRILLKNAMPSTIPTTSCPMCS